MYMLVVDIDVNVRNVPGVANGRNAVLSDDKGLLETTCPICGLLRGPASLDTARPRVMLLLD